MQDIEFLFHSASDLFFHNIYYNSSRLVCLLFHVSMTKYVLCYRLLIPSLRWYLRDKGSYLTAREEGKFGNLSCATTMKKYKILIPSEPGIKNEFLPWMSQDAKQKISAQERVAKRPPGQ